jgi:hypothetical protein
MELNEICKIISGDLSELFFVSGQMEFLVPYQPTLKSYLSGLQNTGKEFFIHSGQGHNAVNLFTTIRTPTNICIPCLFFLVNTVMCLVLAFLRK